MVKTLSFLTCSSDDVNLHCFFINDKSLMYTVDKHFLTNDAWRVGWVLQCCPSVWCRMVMIKESGLVNYWKAQWWPRQSFCSRGLVTEAKAVTMNDVQGAYYLMAILLAVSFLALMVEGAYRKSRASNFTRHLGDSKTLYQNGDLHSNKPRFWTLS